MDPKENYDEWGNSNYYFFFRMDDPANAEDVKENFKKNFDKTKMAGSDLDWERDKIDLHITPLTQLHFLTNASYDSMPKAMANSTGTVCHRFHNPADCRYQFYELQHGIDADAH